MQPGGPARSTPLHDHTRSDVRCCLLPRSQLAMVTEDPAGGRPVANGSAGKSSAPSAPDVVQYGRPRRARNGYRRSLLRTNGSGLPCRSTLPAPMSPPDLLSGPVWYVWHTYAPNSTQQTEDPHGNFDVPGVGSGLPEDARQSIRDSGQRCGVRRSEEDRSIRPARLPPRAGYAQPDAAGADRDAIMPGAAPPGSPASNRRPTKTTKRASPSSRPGSTRRWHSSIP